MRKPQANRLIAATVATCCVLLYMGAKCLQEYVHLSLLDRLCQLFVVLAILLVLFIMADFLLSNRAYKGIRYFFNYWHTRNLLEKQMLDAGFGIQRSYYIELPKISFSFKNDYSSGVLRIRNTLKFDRKLDDIVMSSGLGKFIVDNHYVTDDGNFYIYELLNGTTSFKLIFNSFDDFLEYSKKVPPYKLFLDKRSEIRLQHTLLVGMTGSGKTYSLYSLLLQMLNKNVSYHLYLADPKGSSLAVIGASIAPKSTAVSMQEITAQLTVFVDMMHQRKADLKEHLKGKVDADYSDFNLEPHIFIFDEYASFAAVLASCEKKERDRVKALLYEIILQGRQLGFFLFLVMQKSDATLIETALRDNIPLKIVLGNSEQQTYITAFGAGVDIPKRHFLVCEGVFTEPVVAPEPRLVQFPYCNFDILQACSRARVM